MKRHIAIPLLCVVLVAALSIPVFATPEDSPTFPYPENDVAGSAVVRFFPSVASAPVDPNITSSVTLSFGELWYAYFNSSSYFDDYTIFTDLSFNISITVAGSIYIAVPDYSDKIFNYPSLQNYYDSTSDYYVGFGDINMTSYTPTSSGFSTGQTTASLNVKFLHFKDVPVGSYNISCESMWDKTGVYCFGVYVSQGDAYGSVVDQFVNGSISYTDAVDLLFEFQESLNPVDDHEAMVQALELQNNLTKLNNAASTVASVKANDLDNRMGSVIDSFASGDVTMKYAMDTMQTDFSDALSGAQTVDEAQAVIAVYKANLKQLELQSQFQLMEGFDAIISDDEMQKTDDYYAAEEELVESFDVAEFDAMLQLEAWYLQLPVGESAQYKRFFDYLLNDSPLRLFVIIPLTMGLVTILLGTRMYTRPEPVSRTTIHHSDGSRSTIFKYKDE